MRKLWILVVLLFIFLGGYLFLKTWIFWEPVESLSEGNQALSKDLDVFRASPQNALKEFKEKKIDFYRSQLKNVSAEYPHANAPFALLNSKAFNRNCYKYNEALPKDAPLPAVDMSEWVVLAVHGLRDSPWYVSRIANSLCQRFSFNVIAPLLPHHGYKEDKILAQTSLELWKKEVLESLRIARGLGKKILFVGYSTGGALGIWLASQFPGSVDALLLFSPALQLTGLKKNYLAITTQARRIPFKKTMRKLYEDYVEKSRLNPENPFRYRYVEYNGTKALGALMFENKGAQKENLKGLPVFIVAPKTDETADSKVSYRFFKELNLIEEDNSNFLRYEDFPLTHASSVMDRESYLVDPYFKIKDKPERHNLEEIIDKTWKNTEKSFLKWVEKRLL